MANQDFDMVVVNQFERPTSADINTLESQLNRTIRDVLAPLFAIGAGIPVEGFLAGAFTPTPATPPTPGEVGIQLAAGLGFLYADAGSAVNPIPTVPPVTGLSDLSRYKPLLLSSNKIMSLGLPAAAGNCRRDLVCVSWKRAVDYQTIPIFSAGAGIFAGALRPKNVTADLSAEAVEIVPWGNSPSGALRVIVMRGQEVPYVNENTFLTGAPGSAPVAAVPPGFVPVAIANVRDTTSLPQTQIVDYRSVLVPNGTTTVGASVDVRQDNTFFANLKKAVPAGWRLCAFAPVSATIAGQRATFVLVAGKSDSFAVASDDMTLRNSGITFVGNVVSEARNRMLYEGFDAGIGNWGVDQGIATIIRGLDPAYQVLGAFDVAVGQPFFQFTGVYGVENLTAALTSFGATKLDGSLSTPTGLPGTNIISDFTTASTGGRATNATLGDTGSAPTNVPVTATGVSGGGPVSSLLNVKTLVGGALANYSISFRATLQRA